MALKGNLRSFLKIGFTFQLLAQGIGNSEGLIAEIAEASREQSPGITQINSALAEIDQVTQETAANAEGSASAAEDMRSQTDQTRISITSLLSLLEGARDAGFGSDTARALPSGDGALVPSGLRLTVLAAQQDAKR